MTLHDAVEPFWRGQQCIVAATGPSLTEEVAERCRKAHEAGSHKVLVVNDAWRLMPWADALYACDAAWWDHHKGTDFAGAKWSSHHANGNDKKRQAEQWRLNLVHGASKQGFSTDPSLIHYGSNSGFQAVNLAILFGVCRIVLVGFNMQDVGGRRHFFGDHPGRLQRSAKYERFVPAFKAAARKMPAGVMIENATPNTALRCFPCLPIEEALSAQA